jgi:uncharacterized protein YcfJ
MKLKALAVAIAMMATGVNAEVRLHKESEPSWSQGNSYSPSPLYNQNNDLVRHFPVVRVEPIVEKQHYNVVQHVCTSNQVPMYRDVPVTQVTEPSPSAPLVGLLLGAAIGNSVAKGNNRTPATIAGAAIGYHVGSSPSSRVVGYTTEHVGYHQVNNCQPVSQSHSRDIIIAYQVTYDDNGTFRTITSRSHPGQYVRVVTSTRIF